MYHDNIQEYVSQAAAANFSQANSGYRPSMVSNQIRPLVFLPFRILMQIVKTISIEEITSINFWRRCRGEGVVVISSSLDMLTNNCLGGIMVSLIFLEGLDKEALVEFMIPKGVCQNAEIIAVPRWDSGQLHRNSGGYSRRICDL
ncbi:hypothetical protein Tco_1426152 [Tanacetum coccineum]